MLFGNPDEFAIEAYHEPQGPSWMGFGRMALHLPGVTLGRLSEEHCGLHDAAERIRGVTNRIRELWLPEFAGHSDAEIFALIDKELYVDYGQTETGIESGLRRYGRFDFLTNAGEQFDDIKAFILCDPKHFVHILHGDRKGVFRSSTCSLEPFVVACRTFLKWFDAEVGAKVGAV